MYSDPTAKFITGNEQRYFKYDPGPSPKPFNIYIKTDGHITVCAMVFAQSEPHAVHIFEDYVEWFDKMGKLYKKAKKYDLHGFCDRHDHKLAEFKLALAENRVTFKPCSTNQMYKIGWASNDTW